MQILLEGHIETYGNKSIEIRPGQNQGCIPGNQPGSIRLSGPGGGFQGNELTQCVEILLLFTLFSQNNRQLVTRLNIDRKWLRKFFYILLINCCGLIQVADLGV